MAKGSFQGTIINPKKFHRSQIGYYVVLIPLAVFMALPILYIFNHAFKPQDELFAFPPTFLAQNPSFDNFTALFAYTSTGGVPMSRYIFNSIVVTAVTIFLSILISSMAGFALSKLKFKMKRPLMIANNIALMFISTAVLIPRYVVINFFGLIDNFLVHILPGLAIPVGLFLIKQFIDQTPDELIDAARIDGATDFRVYWSIILPIIKPAIATVAILCFQTVWNNTETSANFITTEEYKTFAFYMNTLTTTNNTVAGQGQAAAASLIMFIPNLIVFIFLQSKIMNTMAHSGIK